MVICAVPSQCRALLYCVKHGSRETGAKRQRFTASNCENNVFYSMSMEHMTLKCFQWCVGMVYGATELLNTSCAPSHSMAQWLACTRWGGVWVGGWKWRNIKCNSCTFTLGNLPYSTMDKALLDLVMSSLMPHLLELGRYYVQRPGPSQKVYQGGCWQPLQYVLECAMACFWGGTPWPQAIGWVGVTRLT